MTSAAATLAERSPSAEALRMMASAEEASNFLKTLAHGSRLLLLCLLAEKERSVSELAQMLGLRQPAVSQQLARLRADGLVATRREGKAVIYRIADERTTRFINGLYETFCR